ncbi:MAG: hypothetical protein WC745_02740 [Patescibacteria group bacterium]
MIRRKELLSNLYDGVEKNGALAEIEKKELNFEADLFMVMHCYFSKLKINSRNYTRRTVRGYNGRERKIYSDNQRNVALAETQQFLAMLIIASGKHSLESITAYAGKIKGLYYDGGEQDLSKDEEDDPARQLEKGISGLAAAYYYYQSKGYSVIISSPAMDANQGIDLFLADTKRMRHDHVVEQKFDFKNMKTLDETPSALRPYITIVQVKCHADKTGRESKELIYSPQLLADYVEKINHHRLIKYYEKRFGSAGENPHGESGENGDKWEDFEEKFRELEFPQTVKIEDLEIPSGFCARYIDLKMKDAKELIDSAGVADRGWNDIHQERVIGRAIYPVKR